MAKIEKDAYYFPHFSNARHDRKLKRVQKELGIEGYGIYFMLLEVLRDAPGMKYPLDDIDLLADEFGTSEQKIRIVLCNYGLFNTDENNLIYSQNLIMYLGPYFERKEHARRAALARWDAGNARALPEQCGSNASKVKYSKVKESKEEEQPEEIPYSEIVEYLNERCNTSYHSSSEATRRHISARWQEGFREDDFRRVIDSRADVWQDDDKMSQYLRPQTLFGTKFESYLNAAPDDKPDPIEWQAKKAQEGLIRFNNE